MPDWLKIHPHPVARSEALDAASLKQGTQSSGGLELGVWCRETVVVGAPVGCARSHSRAFLMELERISAVDRDLLSKIREFLAVHNPQQIHRNRGIDTPTGGKKITFNPVNMTSVKRMELSSRKGCWKGASAQTFFANMQCRIKCSAVSLSPHLGRETLAPTPRFFRLAPRGRVPYRAST